MKTRVPLRRNLWLKAIPTVAMAVPLLLLVGPTAFAQPPAPPAVYEVTRSDCYWPAQNDFNSSDPLYESTTTGGDFPQRCQSHGLDIYENNQYLDDGGDDKVAGCADIKYFRSATDGTWLFLEWELAGLPDGTATDCQVPPENTSHQVAVEFDIDADIRGDVMLTGSTTNCAVGTWTDVSGIGWTGHQDTGTNADDVGGSDPGTGTDCASALVAAPIRLSTLADGKTYPGTPPQDGCSEKNPEGCFVSGVPCDGYAVDLIPADGDAYCRWDQGTKFRLAVERTYIGLSTCTPPCEGKLRIRPWSDAATSFDKGKMYEHDILDPSHLGSDRRDNLPFFTGTTRITLAALAATAGPGGLFAIALAAAGLLAAGVVTVAVLATRRSRTRVD